MSGFIKSSKNIAEHTSNVSTGIPTLDAFIQLPPGTVTAIYEDENSFMHNTMLQIFTSESISLSQQERPTRIISMERKHLFYFDKQKKQEENSEADPKLIIAWRYSCLKNDNENFKYDLSQKRMLDESICIDNNDSIFEKIIETLKNGKNHNIVIYSLFSPLYFMNDTYKSKLLNVLFEIRKYARLNGHVVYLSIPTFLIDIDPSPFLDNILSLTSLLEMPGEKFFYGCILELKKFARNGPVNLESYKYGIKTSSKRFRVERIDIPPEENAGASSSGCGQQF